MRVFSTAIALAGLFVVSANVRAIAGDEEGKALGSLNRDSDQPLSRNFTPALGNERYAQVGDSCQTCQNWCFRQGQQWIANCSQFRGVYNDRCIRQARDNINVCNEQCDC